MKLKIGLLIALAFLAGLYATRAQAPQAYTMSGSAAHSTCLTPASGAYYLCVASDGIWVSNNGGAYFQLVSSSGGVTSVNGKTGAVVISATTSSTTTIN